MNIIVLCLLILTRSAQCTWLFKEDTVCDPTKENVIVPYTGFRITRQYTFGFPTLHHVWLSHCDHGVVDMEAYVPTDRNHDIVWGVSMCVSSDKCYRAVRKKKYANRIISIYLPYTQVGGLFLCPGMNIECTNDNARPVLPLLADRIANKWIEYPRWRRIVSRVPYLFTPNYYDFRYPHSQIKFVQWASKLDINENYEYSAKDKMTISTVTNNVLNLLHNALVIDPSRLPWEKDRLVSQLQADHRPPVTVDIVSYLWPQWWTNINENVLQQAYGQMLPLDDLEEVDDIAHGPELLSWGESPSNASYDN
jgi:hypothetical protein